MPPFYQHKIRAQVFQAVSDAEAEIMSSTRPPSNCSSSYGSGASQPPAYIPYSSPQSTPQSAVPQYPREEDSQILTNYPGSSSRSLTDYYIFLFCY